MAMDERCRMDRILLNRALSSSPMVWGPRGWSQGTLKADCGVRGEASSSLLLAGSGLSLRRFAYGWSRRIDR